MRWVPFAILGYLVLLAQTSVVRILTFEAGSLGAVGPDLVAVVALFAALNARSWQDAMLAAWCLGLGVDLTTSGGTGGVTVVGPMAVGYALAALAVNRMREAFFREWLVTQALTGLLFCLLAHGLWVTWQSLLAGDNMTWARYGHLLVQAGLLSAYTAALAPVVHLVLNRVSGWLVPTSAGRAARTGGSARRY